MLSELKVQNFAIIDSIHIQFGEGLNIMSGETGAGKSVLLKSLALLMGEKSTPDVVRTGATEAVIEGVFDLSRRPDTRTILEELGIEADEDVMVVRRVLSPQGKSRVYINGSLSALSNLRDVVAPLVEVAGHVAPLIEMTGQHDNKNLLNKSYHLDLLDHYIGGWKLRHSIQQKYLESRVLREEIRKINEESKTRAQKLDFLTFQRDEIKALDLVPGEEQNLEAQVARLKNSARLSEFAAQAESALYSDDESSLVRIHSIHQKTMEALRLDPSLAPILESLQQAKALLEDAVYEIREYGRTLGGDADELDRLQERLSQLRRLQKKFGGSVAEILAQLAQIEEEIQGLETADSRVETLERELLALDKEMIHLTLDLHERRVQGAKLLADGVNDELLDLNMKGVEFSVQIAKTEEIGPNGNSDVEFVIRSSKSDKYRPLSKFASGGELSRILLSLKRIIGHSEMPRCYLFDEVDAGVSGQTAEKVGKKLKSIAGGQQVICVTHLPQVAGHADLHFLIAKSPSKKGVHMEVQRLNKEDRVHEIARLISGEKITKTSLEHARQLLSK